MACIPNQGGGGSCNLNIKTSPPAAGLVMPHVSVVRSPFMGGSAIIDGQSVPVWGFNDGYSAFQTGPFPSPTIRVRQGQIVHTVLYTPSMPHTIHHHGIEPAQAFDGVGHTSFDVLGFYTYQWRPHQAGTYMYHCHVNTVVHVEMGMYGALIVDPPSGPGTASDGTTKYDVEALWVVDDIDMRWHCLTWDAGSCGADVGLDRFEPQIFCITGKGQKELDADAASRAPVVAIAAARGATVLLRYIVAGYVPQRITFDARLGEVVVIAEDGRPLAVPTRLPAGSSFVAVSGERYEVILRPTISARNIPIAIEFLDHRMVTGTPRTIGRIAGYVSVT